MKDIIVIGGGLMGSASAWHLSKYGQKVLLIEQQDRIYESGSSLGAARISRSLGPKNDVFSFVQQKTVEESKKLLHYLNGLDTSKPHKMSQIYTTSPVTYLFDKKQKNEIDALLHKKQQDKYKAAVGDEAFRKFGISLPDSYLIIREFKKYSGTLHPKAMIEKLRMGIEKKGNEIWYNQKVIRLQKKAGVYELKLSDAKTQKTKIIKAKKVVVAAGPYIPKLMRHLAPYFQQLIVPKKVDLAFFRITKKRYAALSDLQKKNLKNAHPVFDQHGTQFFSMIEKWNKTTSPIFKSGEHFNRKNILDLDSVWAEKPHQKDLKSLKKYFKKYLEMLEIYVSKKEIELVDNYSCVYSVTSTKIPYATNILDKNGRIDSDLVVIGGMSGIGAKGCLGYGLLAANSLLGITDSDPIYQKAKQAFGNPELRLRTKKRKRNKVFL